jgi:hypothetical protein
MQVIIRSCVLKLWWFQSFGTPKKLWQKSLTQKNQSWQGLFALRYVNENSNWTFSKKEKNQLLFWTQSDFKEFNVDQLFFCIMLRHWLLNLKKIWLLNTYLHQYYFIWFILFKFFLCSWIFIFRFPFKKLKENLKTEIFFHKNFYIFTHWFPAFAHTYMIRRNWSRLFSSKKKGLVCINIKFGTIFLNKPILDHFNLYLNYLFSLTDSEFQLFVADNIR